MDLATFINLLIVAALMAIMLSMGLKVKFAEVVASGRWTRCPRPLQQILLGLPE
jgi:predicted Na+-dependent transporter